MLALAACGGQRDAPGSTGPETAGLNSGPTAGGEAAADGSGSLPEEAGPDDVQAYFDG